MSKQHGDQVSYADTRLMRDGAVFVPSWVRRVVASGRLAYGWGSVSRGRGDTWGCWRSTNGGRAAGRHLSVGSSGTSGAGFTAIVVRLRSI